MKQPLKDKSPAAEVKEPLKDKLPAAEKGIMIPTLHTNIYACKYDQNHTVLIRSLSICAAGPLLIVSWKETLLRVCY